MADFHKNKFLAKVKKYGHDLEITDDNFLELCYKLKEYFENKCNVGVFGLRYGGWEFGKGGKFNIIFHPSVMNYVGDINQRLIFNSLYRHGYHELVREIDKFAKQNSFSKKNNRYENGIYELYIHSDIANIYITLSTGGKESNIFESVKLI